MNRFGGFRGICRTAGMVPYQEWFFFEGQLDLLVELKRYLDEFSGCDYRVFPKVLDIERNGFVQLHSLIQYYGGRKFLAARLSMLEPLCTKSHSDHGIRNGGPVSSHSIMKFGLFDLDFAVRLLKFVREDHLKRSPPLKHPVLSMPSRSKLLSNALEGEWLCAKIDEFGGDENVARRLGLELFATESIVTEKQRMGSFSERYSQQ